MGGGAVVIGGDNMPSPSPPVRILLTDLSNVGPSAPPAPPVLASQIVATYIIMLCEPKLYIPSTLNIDLIHTVAHTIDCVCSNMLNHGLDNYDYDRKIRYKVDP